MMSVAGAILQYFNGGALMGEKENLLNARHDAFLVWRDEPSDENWRLYTIARDALLTLEGTT